MVYHHGRSRIVIALLIGALLLLAHAHGLLADNDSTVSMPASGLDYLGGQESPAVWNKLGQRLTIQATISAIGYDVRRVGNPSGNISICIWNFETKELIATEVWGDAADLPQLAKGEHSIVTLDPPIEVHGEVIIGVQYCGGNTTDYCMAGYYSGDKTAGETYMNCTHDGQWHDIGEAEEGAYYYAYIEEVGSPTQGEGDGFNEAWVAIPILLGVLGGIYFTSRRKK